MKNPEYVSRKIMDRYNDRIKRRLDRLVEQVRDIAAALAPLVVKYEEE